MTEHEIIRISYVSTIFRVVKLMKLHHCKMQRITNIYTSKKQPKIYLPEIAFDKQLPYNFLDYHFSINYDPLLFTDLLIDGRMKKP